MKKLFLAAGLISALSGVAHAEVIRHTTPGSDFPILRAVEIPADATLVYLSGVVPGVTNTDAEEGSPDAYGNTEEQTVSVLRRIQNNLEDIGLTMATSSKCRFISSQKRTRQWISGAS